LLLIPLIVMNRNFDKEALASQEEASKRLLASELASLVITSIEQRKAQYGQTERFLPQPARKIDAKEAISVLFNERTKEMHQMDSLTSETLIKELARAKGGSAELALALLDELVSQSNQATASTSGRAVGKGAYDAALSVCCTQLFGAVAAREALRVFFLIPSADRDVGSCNLAISACSHWGNLKGVMTVVDDMSLQGVQPNDFTVRSALQACMFKRRGGMHLEAVELVKKLSSMSSGGKQGQRLSNEVVDALLLICEAAMDKAGSLEGAEAAFQALGSLPGRLHHTQRAYNSLLKACARQGKWQAAKRHFEAMIEHGVAINTVSFNSLIRAALKGSALTLAIEVFEQMVSGKGVADPEILADMETYNLLIMTCHQAGMLEKALEIASWADRSGFKFNKTTYDELTATAEVAEIWDRKAVREATENSLAVFPHHLRPSHFDSLRLSYLDHLPELDDEESLAITKLRDKSWAPATLTKGRGSPASGKNIFSPRTIAAIQSKLPGLDKSLYLPSSPSPVPSGKGFSSPLVLSRLPTFNSNVAAAIDKAAESMVELVRDGDEREGDMTGPEPIHFIDHL
jgi:pentatricopeptide repeat protein